MPADFRPHARRRVVGVNADGQPTTRDDVGSETAHGDAYDLDAPANGVNGHAATEKPKAELLLTKMSAVVPEPVNWLWRNWLPLGAVSILDGDPGRGKSTLCLDLAARVTRGRKMPPDSEDDPDRPPAFVLLLTAEDSLKHTVRPRLDAAGADASRVLNVDGVKVGEDARDVQLPWDLDLIGEKAKAKGALLIIVDPFTAFLAGEYDAHKDQDVRRGLRPLAKLADELGVCVLLLRHLNKLSGGAAMYRGGGSIAITGAARSSLIVGRDPDDDRKYVLAMNKPNLGPFPRSLAYRLEPAEMGVTRVGWLGETDLLADQILGHPSPKADGEEARDAEAVVRELLAGGPIESSAFAAACKAKGLSDRTVYRVRKKIGVVARKDRFDGGWTAALPDEGCQAPPDLV